MPPHAGMMPSATWLNPQRTSSAAMRMSHATATSAPPPYASPFTAATTGTGNVASRSRTARMVAAMAAASSRVRIAASSLRSPPATNTRLPAPVTTSTCAGDRVDLVERVRELAHGRPGDGVAGLGPVDGEHRDRAVVVEPHVAAADHPGKISDLPRCDSGRPALATRR